MTVLDEIVAVFGGWHCRRRTRAAERKAQAFIENWWFAVDREGARARANQA